KYKVKQGCRNVKCFTSKSRTRYKTAALGGARLLASLAHWSAPEGVSPRKTAENGKGAPMGGAFVSRQRLSRGYRRAGSRPVERRRKGGPLAHPPDTKKHPRRDAFAPGVCVCLWGGWL